MAFGDGDLDAFLADFGVNVTGPASSSGKGILDQADKLFGGDVDIISTEYELTVKTASFPGLVAGDSVTANSVNYVVRQASKLDDGSFTKVLLTKV